MGNTADWAMVQKTIIETLQKEGKSQRVITERVAVQWVLYQSILNAKLTGGKKFGRKMCTSNRDDRKFENTVKPIQTLGRASQGVNWSWSHHAQTSSGKGLPSHFWNRNIARSILGWGEKEWYCCSVLQSPLFRLKSILHFIWKSRSESEEEWRDTESMLLEVQWEVSTVSDDLGCHVICWCWSTVFSEVHSQHSRIPGRFRALHASFCWQALRRCWFHFPAGLGTCPHCQRYQKLVQWP